ncbi:MAG: PpiC-type peptidyl-prolyl cis-trans isomerase [Acidobacteria bacterium]|nr:PpiC-type peptidyl-prolyl cis-trans isomerase [Acidobacteriota bacterium]
MNFRITRLAGLTALAFIIMLVPSLALAQEGELQVVDEVIAQVNDDVITLSQLKREMKERIDALKQDGRMTEQQATEEVAKHRDDLIATLINEQLLLQKGKELEMSQKVEDEVNRRMVDVMKEQGFKTIVEMERAMRESGIDPVATRATMRAEIMKQAVLQEEVDSKLYFSPTMGELHTYFDAHKDKFKKAETITLSEIYLSLAGKNEADVKALAEKLVAQLRAGGDFKALAVANSEREQAGERTALKTQGQVGVFEIPNLREDVAGAIKKVPSGGISEPLRTNDGYQIFRVDARTAGSDASVFAENQVREAMTTEKAPKAREDYLQKLRNESYISVSEKYREGVAAVLKLKPEAIVTSTGASEAKPAKKGKGKFLKIFPKP